MVHKKVILELLTEQAIAMAVCLRLSVRHKSVFYQNGRTHPAGFWHVGFFQPILHCAVRKFRYLFQE